LANREYYSEEYGMNIKDIKDGKTYMITGSHNGCVRKCIDCSSYPEHKIICIGIDKSYYDMRIVAGKHFNNTNNCHFDPRDLSPIDKSFEEFLE
jgi:hypothetical protein